MTVRTADGDLEFTTSGTTGEPQRWLRSRGQVAAEARLLVRLLTGHQGWQRTAEGPPVDGVLCYAPPRHLYGHLMSVEVPRLLRVPCVQGGLTASPDGSLRGWRHPMIATVPAAFAVLARSLPALQDAERITLVHSSAVLPPAVPPVLAALGERARLVELFGSTETGLIASRSGGSGPWALASDTRFAPAAEPGTHRALRVSSPRLARRPGRDTPAATETGDLVTVLDERGFQWHGRTRGLVKVNGLRVDLDRVSAGLRRAVPDVAIECRPEPDPLRGEWYAVHADTDDPQRLARVAEAVRRLPAAELPRAVVPRRAAAVPPPACAAAVPPPARPEEPENR